MGEFGYHTIGTSSLDFGSAGFGCKFSLTEAGTLSKISFYGKAASGTVNVKAALFAISAGEPGAKLIESSVTAVSTTLQWWDCEIVGDSQHVAGDYFLALLTSADLTVYFLATTGTNIYAQDSSTYPNFTSPFGGTFSWDAELSIYATYGAGASLNVPVGTKAPLPLFSQT
jgi:hypothetical protein